MANQDRQAQRQTKSQQPSLDLEEGVERKGGARTPTAAVTRAGRSVDAQASRLGDRRLHSAQRQAMALHIGRTQGNRHVQRVVASTRRATSAAGLTTDESMDGIGSSGPPSLAAATPPDPPGSGSRALRRQSPLSGAGSPAIVQRDLLDDARAAAQGLLDRLMGRADDEGGQIESQSSTDSSQVSADVDTRGAALRSDVEGQGAQLEESGAAEQASLETQADAQGAAIEAQAAGAEAELQSGWEGLESQATGMGTELTGEVEGRTAALNGEAAGLSAQMVGGWTSREEEVGTEMSGLEREARGLYDSSQQRARQLLNRGGSSDVSGAAQAIEAAWDALVGRLDPFRGRLGEIWDRFTGWASTLFEPLIRQVRQLAQWVTQQVQRIARLVRQVWSWLTSAVTRARTLIRNLRTRALNVVRRLASAALNRVRNGARRAWQVAQRAVTRVTDFVQRIGGRLLSRLRQRASAAVANMRRAASRIVRFFAGAVGRLVSRLRGVADPALSRLRDSAGAAWDLVRNVGQGALNWLRDVSSPVLDALRQAGTQVQGMLQRIGEAALGMLSRVWGWIGRAWSALGERMNGLFERLQEGARSLVQVLRDRFLQPAWDWVRGRWQNLSENVRFALGRLLRGWRRLKAWASSARARASSGSAADLDAVEGEARERAEAPFESVFFKRDRAGVGTRTAGPARASLSAGRPLDARLRSRMESAFGHSFAEVRVHTGADASRATRESGARALTMGSDVAFGQGEYQPGTPIGDALIAHELAHVIQQKGATAVQREAGPRDAVESDADRSAIGAVAALWTGARDALQRIPQNALPRLRSGLRLSACRKGYPEGVPYPQVTIGAVHTGPPLPQGITRIPPRKGIDVPVQVDGWQENMPPIELFVAGESGRPSDRAQVNGEQVAEIASDGAQSVKVSGDQPLTSRPFQLVAKIDERTLARSDSFYIAAHPSGVQFTFSGTMGGEAHEGKQYWGAIYGLNISSDSGSAEDLGLVEVTEIIQKVNPTGFFAEIPLRRSGFMPALSPHPDHHGVSFGSAQAFKSVIDTDAGAMEEQVQYFRFSGGGAGIPQDYAEGPIVPGSGFKITLKVTKTSDGRYFLHVSKQGHANNGATAGTVAGSEEKKIEVK